MAPPHDHGRRPTLGARPDRAIRLLAAHLACAALAPVALACTAAPHTDVLLARAPLPLALWALHRHGQGTGRTRALTSNQEHRS